ncbi:hypothetical protein KM043_013771 [Ampulex compressa]|nr:hypothetical protein KM043_013771 [Ampulex compressa]
MQMDGCEEKVRAASRRNRFGEGAPITGIAWRLSYHSVSAVRPTQCLDSRKVLVKISQDVAACYAKTDLLHAPVGLTFHSLLHLWDAHAAIRKPMPGIFNIDTSAPRGMNGTGEAPALAGTVVVYNAMHGHRTRISFFFFFFFFLTDDRKTK